MLRTNDGFDKKGYNRYLKIRKGVYQLQNDMILSNKFMH